MLLPTPTIHRVAALVFLIGSLVLLADGTARFELAQAVNAALNDGAQVLAHVAVAGGPERTKRPS